MILIAYGLFFVIYFAVSVAIVIAARKLAGENKKHKRIAGILAGIFMYMLVFWDLIPVFVQHKYLCETQAGFWVYKTPEEWIKENPEMVGEKWGDVQWIKMHKDEVLPDGVQRYWTSSRVYNEIHRDGDFFHAISRREQRLIDSKTNQILAKSIEFYRGGRNPFAMGSDSLADYKIWLGMGRRVCGDSGTQGYTSLFSKNLYKLETIGLGEE